MQRNWVGHVYSPAVNADKIYMFGVREVEGEWVVIAKWGRRGRSPSNQQKGSKSSLPTALGLMSVLIREKERDGYLSIESQEYITHIMRVSGGSISPLTVHDAQIALNLEDESGVSASPTLPTIPSVPVVAPQPPIVTEEEMVCCDNSGVPEMFDVGIEYIVVTHPDKDMIYAYDKTGEKRECFAARFCSVRKWKKANR